MSGPSTPSPGIVQPVTFQPVTFKLPWLKSAADIGSMSFPEPTFVLKGVLPPGLSMFAGKPKGGKSFFLLELNLAVATGRPYLGRETLQGSVLYFALEDNARRIQWRLNQLNGGLPLPDNLHFAFLADKIGAGLEKKIEEWINTVPDPRLIVVDTMARVMPESKAGNNDYQHATDVLGEKQQSMLEQDVAAVLVNHTRKGDRGDKAEDIFEEAIGSTGISGVMDTMMVLERSRMESLATVHFTGRDIEEGTVDIERTPGGGWRASDRRKPLHEELGVTPERQDVLKAIYAGRKSTGDIANATGKGASNVSNMLARLKDNGFVVRTASGEYELAPETADKVDQYAARGELGELGETGEQEASNIVQDGDSTLDAVQVDGEQAVNPVYVPPEEGRSSGLPS